MSDKIRVFDDKKVRMEWNEEEQDWYLSIVDVISILTDQPTTQRKQLLAKAETAHERGGE
jgi:hypothetical protein